jgi:hypothetical protein
MFGFSMKCTALLCLGLLPLLAFPAFADSAKLESVTLGDHQAGPSLAASELKGKVFVLFTFRAKSKRAAEALTQARELWKTHGCEELAFLATTEGGDAPKLDGLAQLSVFKQITLEGRALRERGACVFGQDGRLAYKGDLTKAAFSQALETALARARPPFRSGIKQARVVRQADEAVDKQRYGKALRALARLSQDGSAAEKAEAQRLTQRLLRFGRRQLDAVDPAQAIQTEEALNGLKKSFAKHELGKAATERLRELMRDRAFRSELEAAKLLRKLKAIARGLKPCGRCGGGGGGSMSFGDDDDDDAPPSVSLACLGCRQANRRGAGALAAGFKKLKKRCAKTSSAKLAARLEKALTGQTRGLSFGPR